MAASEHIATQNELQATLMELLEFGSTVRLWNENFEQELLDRIKARLKESGITIE